jgi:signal transduction histidine kinase
MELTSCDVFVQSSVETWTIHIISLPLLQPSGWRMGQVFLLEDITQVRRTQQQQVQAQQSLATLQERERLARELHDSLGQTLAAARLQVSTARLLLAQGETSQTDKCLEQMVDMTLAAETDVREYLLGTKTAISADHLLFPTLRQYVVRFSQQYGLPVELNVPPQLEVRGLGSQVELQLLRIIQEGLSNVRKHARAKNARIAFTILGLLVQITIIDDGQGFDPVAARQAEGFGLQAMRERAESLGGCLDVFSQSGMGTQVVVQVPIQIDDERGNGKVSR